MWTATGTSPTPAWRQSERKQVVVCVTRWTMYRSSGIFAKAKGTAPNVLEWKPIPMS
jgi:hypothetical protein